MIVITVSLCWASICRKLLLKFQKILQYGAHAIRDGPVDVTRTKCLEL